MLLFFVGCSSPSGSDPNDTDPIPSEDQTVTIISPPTTTIHEGSAINITFERNMSAGELTVQLKIEGDAENGKDYETLSSTVIFNDGEDTATITLTAVDDKTNEGSEDVIITIKPSDLYTVGDSSTATVTIIDPVVIGSPTISISAGSSEVNEDEGGMITFIVSSDKPVTDNLMVSFTIDDVTNSARIHEDYELGPAGNTVTINGGSDRATITLTVYEDEIREENESVIISINVSSSYNIKDSEGSATVTIIDDDLPTVGFRTRSQTLEEGNGETVTVTLERSNDEVRDPLTVQLKIEGDADNGKDYETLSSTVIFNDGEDTATITLTAVGDKTDEGSEDVIITIKPSDLYTVGDSSTATVTIIDPAAAGSPTISISAGSSEVNEDEGVIITFIVSSDKPVTDNLMVSFTIDDVTNSARIHEDYKPGPAGNTVTINGGSDRATITLTVYEDEIREENESVMISINVSSSYNIKDSEGSATVTIIDDDDLPTVGFRTTSQIQRLHEGNDAGVTVTLERSNDEVRDPLTIQLKIEGDAENGKDYETLSSTVIFNDGEDTATITLTAVDDKTNEGSEDVIITIKPSDLYTVGDSSTATVTIIDPVAAGSPTISISAGSSEVNEDEGVIITFIVSSDKLVTDNLMVSFTIDDVTNSARIYEDYQLVPADNTVTINAGEKSAIITLTVYEDEIREENESVMISINVLPHYAIKDSEGSATVTIIDDDLPTVGFRTRSQTLEEVNGESVTVTVERSDDEALLPLEVQLSFVGSTATETEDYTSPVDTSSEAITLTIPDEESSVEFTLQLVNDDIIEREENVTISIVMSEAYHIDGDNDEVIITIVSDDISPDDIDGDMIVNSEDVDDDNDGLIEIHTLEMLRNVHFNLAGTSYDDEDNDGSGNEGDTNGAPTSPTEHCKTKVNGVYLCGYELMHDLDFNDANSYATDTINNDWRPDVNLDRATNKGFPGIGPKTGTNGGFAAIFEGNGHAIKNLYMRNTETTGQSVGLFRLIKLGAKIRNLGVLEVALYGGAGNSDAVGGLVGNNSGGIIIASYATGTIDGGDGNDDVGGLVGYNISDIIASYATTNVYGGAGNDKAGGLVGVSQSLGKIAASYATGTVDGGAGNYDSVGGLVGYHSFASITASYATGDVNGGAGKDDYVGGLVGLNSNGSIITASYGFGEATTVGLGSDGTKQPGSVSALTRSNAGAQWNSPSVNTLGAWDFGTNSQNPALKYADYDGSGDDYSCDLFPACGSLLPGQQR